MKFLDLELPESKYLIKASVKIPDNSDSRTGIILAHGAIINRHSLIRRENSFADYLCKELDAYIIVPDLQGDTIHKNNKQFNDFVEIFNITSKFFVDEYELENLFGFGHSMGCYILSESLKNNKLLDGIATYGGPIKEFNDRKLGFINYLYNYISKYNYSFNVSNLLNYIFDEETCIYLKEVMLKDESYKGNNYIFEFESSTYKNISKYIKNYLYNIEIWKKPALILFGENDKVTEFAPAKDGLSIEKDNLVKEIAGNLTVLETSDNKSFTIDFILTRYNKT